MKKRNEFPDFRKIYEDILRKKFPEKLEDCSELLNKKMTAINIAELNDRIFENTSQESKAINQKYKSYSESDIFYILKFQKKRNLTNIQLGQHFKISKNTIAKWRKNYKAI